MDVHRFLGQRHAHVVLRTTARIYHLRDDVHIDSWRKTAPFPYESMLAAPETSFDKNGTPGRAPSYQWYTRIEVAYQNSRSCDEGLNWEFVNNLVKEILPNQIQRLNRMHREHCGIDNLIPVADGMRLVL